MLLFSFEEKVMAKADSRCSGEKRGLRILCTRAIIRGEKLLQLNNINAGILLAFKNGRQALWEPQYSRLLLSDPNQDCCKTWTTPNYCSPKRLPKQKYSGGSSMFKAIAKFSAAKKKVPRKYPVYLKLR